MEERGRQTLRTTGTLQMRGTVGVQIHGPQESSLRTKLGDGIQVELFQNLKDDAVKVLHSICQQIWKAQQWPQDHC